MTMEKLNQSTKLFGDKNMIKQRIIPIGLIITGLIIIGLQYATSSGGGGP